MEITDVKIKVIENDAKVKAIVSLTIGGVFVVHNIKLVQGEEKLFISMPSKKNSSGKFKDIAHPLTEEARLYMLDKIKEAYESALERKNQKEE